MTKHLPIVLALVVPVAILAAIQYLPVFRPVYRWMSAHDMMTLGIVIVSAMPFGFMAYNRILGNFFNRSTN
jgi:hypothetical protein